MADKSAPGEYLLLHLLRESKEADILVNSCAGVIEGLRQLGLIWGILGVQGFLELQGYQDWIDIRFGRKSFSFNRKTMFALPDPIREDRERHLEKCRVRVSFGEFPFYPALIQGD